MKNIERKTVCQSRPNFRHFEYQIASYTRRVARASITVLLLAGIFLTGTSYHSRYEENQLIERQYFLPELTIALEEMLDLKEDQVSIQVKGNDLRMAPLIHEFYDLHDFCPSFSTYDDVNMHGSVILAMLNSSQYYGLEPESYHLELIRDLQLQLQEKDLKQQHITIRRDIELLMADAVLKFMSHLHSGYRASDSAFFSDAFTASLPVRLRNALSGDDPVASILACQPQFIEYTRLQHAAELFVQSVELKEQWIDLSAVCEDSMLLWQDIREVLRNLGYAVSGTDFTTVSVALKTFQQYHGLEMDGKPGKNTLEALSQSSMHIYRTLALNLDRLRKQDHNTNHALYVNVPSYQLKVIKENNVQQVYRVCVGRTYSPTPLIDGNIEQIVTNPEWNVPARIARNEILPKIRNDVSYLQNNRFTVLDSNQCVVNARSIDWNQVSTDNFPYSIQQSPGANNSLGQVKFLFNNPYSVYLHDTPSKSLFNKDIRAFSHGCVRVEHPEELAAYLVEQLQTEPDDVKDLIHRGIRREIDLQQTIALQIRYITCEGDDEGKLYCYKDIYGLDAKELDDFLLLASL